MASVLFDNLKLGLEAIVVFSVLPVAWAKTGMQCEKKSAALFLVSMR
jgi:hypothetical protein